MLPKAPSGVAVPAALAALFVANVLTAAVSPAGLRGALTGDGPSLAVTYTVLSLQLLSVVLAFVSKSVSPQAFYTLAALLLGLALLPQLLCAALGLCLGLSPAWSAFGGVLLALGVYPLPNGVTLAAAHGFFLARGWAAGSFVLTLAHSVATVAGLLLASLALQESTAAPDAAAAQTEKDQEMQVVSTPLLAAPLEPAQRVPRGLTTGLCMAFAIAVLAEVLANAVHFAASGRSLAQLVAQPGFALLWASFPIAFLPVALCWLPRRALREAGLALPALAVELMLIWAAVRYLADPAAFVAAASPAGHDGPVLQAPWSVPLLAAIGTAVMVLVPALIFRVEGLHTRAVERMALRLLFAVVLVLLLWTVVLFVDMRLTGQDVQLQCLAIALCLLQPYILYFVWACGALSDRVRLNAAQRLAAIKLLWLSLLLASVAVLQGLRVWSGYPLLLVVGTAGIVPTLGAAARAAAVLATLRVTDWAPAAPAAWQPKQPPAAPSEML